MAINEFETAIALIYQSVASPDKWMEAMQCVARLVDAPRATKFSFDPQTGRVWDVSGLGHEDATIASYQAYFSRLDPGFPVGAASAVGVWHGDEEMLDDRAQSQQEFIRDFAYRNGMGRVGGAKLAASETSAVYFSVIRDVGAPRFADNGRESFCRLLPHLMQAEALKARLASLVDQAAVAQSALDHFSAAAFAVDQDQNLRGANSGAESMFAAARQLLIRGNKVYASSSAVERSFVQAVAHALPPLMQASAFSIPASGGRPALQLLVLPLSATHHLTSLYPKPMALVIAAETLVNHLTPKIYRQLYELTDAEAALVHALANGATVSTWAVARCIAISTARTHLASALGKTGCATQGDLLRQALALPAVRALE